MRKELYSVMGLTLSLVLVVSGTTRGLAEDARSDSSPALDTAWLSENLLQAAQDAPAVQARHVEQIVPALLDLAAAMHLRTLSESHMAAFREVASAYFAKHQGWDPSGGLEDEIERGHTVVALAAHLANAPNTLADRAPHAEQIADICQSAQRWIAGLPDAMDSVAGEKALQHFQAYLEAAPIMLPDLSWIRPLPAASHASILEGWRREMALLDVVALAEGRGLYPLDAAAAPQWELEQRLNGLSALLTSGLFRYTRVRAEMFRPPQAQAVLHGEMKRVQEKSHQLLTVEENTRNWQGPRSETRRKIRLYEVFGLLHDAVKWSDPFSAALADPLGLPAATAPAMMCTFRMEYASYPAYEGENRNLPGVLSGYVLSNGKISRVEVLGQEPSWRMRGVIHEPIGISILRERNRLTTYHPALYHMPPRTASLPAPANSNEVRLTNAPLDELLHEVPANREFFGRPSKLEAPDPNAPTTVTARWSYNFPWLYDVSIRSIQVRAEKLEAEGMLFAADETRPIGTLEWSEPILIGGALRGYGRVQLRVTPEVMGEMAAVENVSHPFLEGRSYTWTYQTAHVDAAEVAVPSKFTIEEGDGAAVSVTFSDFEPWDEEGPALSDPVAPIAIPPSHTNDFYSLIKQFYAVRAMNEPAAAVAWAKTNYGEVERLVAQQERQPEVGYLQRAPMFLNEVLTLAGEMEKWRAICIKTVRDVELHCDDAQVSIVAGSLAGMLVQHQEDALLLELLEFFVMNRIERIPVYELLRQGGSHSMGGSKFMGIANFAAAAAKLTPPKKSEVEQSAEEALKRFVVELGSNHTWPEGKLRAFEAKAAHLIQGVAPVTPATSSGH